MYRTMELYVQNIHPVRISKSVIRMSCMPIFQRKVSSWELRNIGKFFHTLTQNTFFAINYLSFLNIIPSERLPSNKVTHLFKNAAKCVSYTHLLQIFPQVVECTNFSLKLTVIMRLFFRLFSYKVYSPFLYSEILVTHHSFTLNSSLLFVPLLFNPYSLFLYSSFLYSPFRNPS